MAVDPVPAVLTRRALLTGAAGTGLLALLPGGAPGPGRPPGQWLFGPFQPGCTETDFNDGGLRPVSFPHCVTELSWWKWNPQSWNGLWVYRRRLNASRDERAVLAFGGVLSAARVHLNGSEIGARVGGYLPFEFELTDHLVTGDNVLAVVVDSRWGLNSPPGRPRPWPVRSIDFYQTGGIPRPIEIRRLPQRYVEEVFAKPVDVLSQRPRVEVTGQLDARHPASGPVTVTARLSHGDQVVAEASTELPGNVTGKVPFELGLSPSGAVALWELDAPNLYEVSVRASAEDRVVHESTVRIGFREARFTREGFFLNGRRVQLFGLGRHELFPYAGPAMPERVQRKDAELLKKELNCTMVRCACYPQSEAFLDACDELGLLVWAEAPGWDYIGNARWREHVLRDVSGLVIRDRNHPSVIAWATRLNETEDDVDLYTATRGIADRLDGSRATTGAVNSTIITPSPEIPEPYRDPFRTTYRVQDVFALNDYLKPPAGQLPTLRPPRTDMPYLVSEAVGALVGPPNFRRTDPVWVQSEQAMMHASVHDKAMSDPRYCGLLGWSAFDYPSGYGAMKDQVKWTGVADLFRIPKFGAAFYRAQVDPARRAVIEPAFRWSPEGPGGDAVIWSNCEELVVFLGGEQLAELHPNRDLFPHLPFPPFMVDLPERGTGTLRIDGFVGGEKAASRSLSADRGRDQLLVLPDDSVLSAEGVDATRVVVGIADSYGTWRGLPAGPMSFVLSGPGVLVGDNPLDVDGNGGVGAVWVRTTGHKGQIRLAARNPSFPAREVTIEVV